MKWQIIFGTTIITCANPIAEMLSFGSLQVTKHLLCGFHHPFGPFVHLSSQLADGETDIRPCPYGQPQQLAHHRLSLSDVFKCWLFFFRKFGIRFRHRNRSWVFYLMSIQQIPSVGLLSHLQLLVIPLTAPLELEPTKSNPAFVINFFRSGASPFFLQPLQEAVFGVRFRKNHKIVHIDDHQTHLPISIRTYFFSRSVTTFTQDSPQISFRRLFQLVLLLHLPRACISLPCEPPHCLVAVHCPMGRAGLKPIQGLVDKPDLIRLGNPKISHDPGRHHRHGFGTLFHRPRSQ